MFTIFLVLDAPLVGFYIHSGVIWKIKPKEENEDSFAQRIVIKCKDIIEHIPIIVFSFRLMKNRVYW